MTPDMWTAFLQGCVIGFALLASIGILLGPRKDHRK